MEIYCGTDIIEIERIKAEICNHKDMFLNRIYTKNEIDYCESKNAMKYQHYAARFAAKEAIFKAISKRLDNKYDVNWLDCEIINNEDGRPVVRILTSKLSMIKNIDISLSHCKDYATAVVIAEFNN